MSHYQLNAVATPAPIAQIRQIEPQHSRKAPSDQPRAPPAASSHGPAVVLGGALAKAAERHVQPATAPARPPADAKATGQHINHVI